MKELANNVIPRVCFKWRDLGLQLNIDYWVLDEIQANCPGNVRECCTRMLAQWLSLDAGTSWSTLVAITGCWGLLVYTSGCTDQQSSEREKTGSKS